MRHVLTTLTCLCFLAAPTFASVDNWTQFRERFPYHIQVIALSAPERDGTRTLIISEPPPSMTLTALTEAYGDVITRIRTREHRVGFDGWVKDIVGVLPAMSPQEQQTFVEDLSRYLFGTSYKAYTLDLSAPPDSKSSYDLMVGASALSDWLGFNQPPSSPVAEAFNRLAWFVGAIATIVLVKRRGGRALTVLTACIIVAYWTTPGRPHAGVAGVLHPLHGGEARMLSDVLAQPTTGVYMSEAPGLVVLVMPRGEELNRAAVSLREFVLDSDLVLGAIGTPHSVAVIGRERQESVIVLPPLRVETLLQLAAASSEELAQSYERMDLFAGRLRAVQRDWAPIFLSPQLHDTEYGSLLNITDQLLKSWSEHGDIKYINFNYPAPQEYPFPEGLLKQAKTTTVTYNWNTKGVGYVDSRDGYDIVAFSRTGALPVDYLGEQDSRMRDYEDQGYNYFAGRTADPNLARVVQYAGLYQIYRHFNLRATFEASTREHGGRDALQPLARTAFERILETNIDELIDPVRLRTDPMVSSAVEDFRRIQRGLQMEAAKGEAALDEMARVAARPREIEGYGADEEQQRRINLVRAMSDSLIVRSLLRDMTDTAAQAFVDAENRGEPAGWIKTPSIVLSWSTAPDGAKLVGGHNLSSRISHFSVDDTLPPGGIRIVEENGQRVVRYSAADAGKIREVVRSVGRNPEMSEYELARMAETGLQTARAEIPSMSAALRLGSRSTEVSSRGLVASRAVPLSNSTPWRLIENRPASHTQALNAIDDPSVFGIVVERTDGKYLVSHAGDAAVLEASTGAGALDAVVELAGSATGGRGVHLHFRGMNSEQARGFARVTELQASRSKAVSVRTSVEAETGTVKVIGEIRRGRWNLAEAEVKMIDAPVGSLRKSVDFDVTIPQLSGPARLRARISVAFKESVRVTGEMLAALKVRIEAILRSIAASDEQLDVLLASRRIIRELRVGDETVATVEIRLAGDAGDIHIVLNLQTARDAVSD